MSVGGQPACPHIALAGGRAWPPSATSPVNAGGGWGWDGEAVDGDARLPHLNPTRSGAIGHMKSIRKAGVSGIRASLEPASTSANVDPSIVRAGKDEEGENNVLPNLLLDVREGFLGAFRSVFREFGVTDQQDRVLSILFRMGDLETSKLARHARIAAPSMTGILDRMTEIGWVARKVPQGQRWGMVALTATGRRLIVKLLPKTTQRFASFEAALGQQKLEQLGELLLDARVALRELVASSPKTAPASGDRALRGRGVIKKRGKPSKRSGPKRKAGGPRS